MDLDGGPIPKTGCIFDSWSGASGCSLVESTGKENCQVHEGCKENERGLRFGLVPIMCCLCLHLPQIKFLTGPQSGGHSLPSRLAVRARIALHALAPHLAMLAAGAQGAVVPQLAVLAPDALHAVLPASPVLALHALPRHRATRSLPRGFAAPLGMRDRGSTRERSKVAKISRKVKRRATLRLHSSVERARGQDVDRLGRRG